MEVTELPYGSVLYQLPSAPNYANRASKNRLWKRVVQQVAAVARFRYFKMYTWCTIFVSLGGFNFGFDTGSTGPMTVMPQFRELFHPISPTLQGLIVSSILIPASIFSLVAGPLSNKISRTYTIALGGAVFAAGSAIAASSLTLPQLLIGRCIAGVGEGLFLSTITVYTCEIVPAAVRGKLSCTTQLFVTFGIASGYFTSYGSVRLQGNIAWRTPLIVQACVASVLALGAARLPHSPRWLRHIGRHAEADEAWAKLQVMRTEAEKEDNEQAAAQRNQDAHQDIRLLANAKLMWSKKFRERTMLGCFIQGMSQACGIDGVLFYAPVLFTQAGLSSAKASFLASGVSGLLNVVCTIITQPFLDKWGRRPTMIYGGSVIAGSMLLIGSLYASHATDTPAGRWAVVVLLYIFVIAFSMSWAIVCRTYSAEIQPNETRASATSLAQCANWAINWVVAFTTPLFLARSIYGPYFMFGGCSVLTVLVCVAFQPESKGLSLEGIEAVFAEGLWERMAKNLHIRKGRRSVGNDTAHTMGSGIFELESLDTPGARRS